MHKILVISWFPFLARVLVAAADGELRNKLVNLAREASLHRLAHARKRQIWEDKPVSPCCTCHACDGCLSERGATTGRRLTLRAHAMSNTDCCSVCERTPHATPAARAIRTARGAQSVQSITTANQIPLAARALATQENNRMSHKTLATSAESISSAESAQKFNLVLFHASNRTKQGVKKDRERLKKQMDYFEFPFDRRGRGYEDAHEETRSFYFMFKDVIQSTEYGFDGLGYGTTFMPMLAMRGKTPCAAGLFTEAHSNDENTTFLNMFIRSKGDSCKGSGAALLCHLIRNSKNRHGEFSPLKVTSVYEEPNITRYFNSFGCKTTAPVEVIPDLDKMDFDEEMLDMLRDSQGSYPPLICSDPNPKRCEAHTDEVFSAADYWDASKIPQPIFRSSLPVPISLGDLSICVQALVSLLACSGIAIAVFRRHHGAPASSEDPFLAT